VKKALTDRYQDFIRVTKWPLQVNRQYLNWLFCFHSYD